MELIIKLRNRKKDIVIELEKKSQFEEFYKEVETHDIVKFGPIIFNRDDLCYATLEVDEYD